jgi:hypothetical protein
LKLTKLPDTKVPFAFEELPDAQISSGPLDAEDPSPPERELNAPETEEPDPPLAMTALLLQEDWSPILELLLAEISVFELLLFDEENAPFSMPTTPATSIEPYEVDEPLLVLPVCDDV